MKDLNQDDINRIIGKNIKYFRKLYNLNVGKMAQEDLAELANISVSLIGNLESNTISQGLSIYTLYKISHILNVPIDKFLMEYPYNDNNKLA